MENVLVAEDKWAESGTIVPVLNFYVRSHSRKQELWSLSAFTSEAQTLRLVLIWTFFKFPCWDDIQAQDLTGLPVKVSAQMGL